MRTFALFILLLAVTTSAKAAEPCQLIHGRAHFYSGDGQLRIWHIGTHHEYEPDQSSWDRVIAWLKAGAKDPGNDDSDMSAFDVYLFGDFMVCPVEPFKKGSVQMARIESVKHRRYTPAD